MLLNPPKTKDTALDKFLRDIQSEINSKVKSLFVPVTQSGNHGTHSIKNLTAGNSTYFDFVLPYDCNQIKEATVRFIPTVSGTMDWTFSINEGAIGEDESANTASDTADGVTCTDDQIQEIDVTTVLGALDKGDQVGCKFTLDTVTTTTDLNVLGLLIKYI